jgi:hypothetical protein
MSLQGSSWSLSGVDDGSVSIHFHLVLFPTASFLPREGLGVVALVAWITAIERRVANLLSYPSLP